MISRIKTLLFGSLLFRSNKALATFTKAKNDLEKVNSEIRKQQVKDSKAIQKIESKLEVKRQLAQENQKFIGKLDSLLK